MAVNLPKYTVATIPGAAQAVQGDLIEVTDGNTPGLYLYDGTEWLVIVSGRPLPLLVYTLATGGTGTLADPWTGYETAVNALLAGTHIDFAPRADGIGYYLPSSTINLKSDWLITGRGRASVIAPTSGTLNIFTGSSVSRVAIKDLAFDGADNGPGLAGGGEELGNVLHCTSCDRIYLNGLYVLEMNGGPTFKTSSRILVDNLFVDTWKAYGAYILGSTDVVIRGANMVNAVVNSSTGIQTQLSGATRSADVLLTGNRIKNTQNGIQVRSTDRVIVTDNVAEVTAPTEFANCIGTNDVFDIEITNNVAKGGGTGTAVIYVADSSNRVDVSHNTAIPSTSTQDGIQVGSAATTIARVIGNLVNGGGEDTGYAIRLDLGGGTVNARYEVIGNVVEAFDGKGIGIGPALTAGQRLTVMGNRVEATTDRGLEVDTGQDLIITNNMIVGCNDAAGGYSVYLDGTRINFSHNTVLNTAGTNSFGVNLAGTNHIVAYNTITQQGVTTQDYGIRIQSGTGVPGHQIHDNYLDGNQVGPISDLSGGGGTTNYRRTGRVVVAFSATPTFDVSRGDYIEFGAMTANVTGITLSNAVKGQRWSIVFTQDGGGGRTVAGWPAGTLLSGAAFTPTATGGAKSILTFQYDGTNHVEVARNLDVR